MIKVDRSFWRLHVHPGVHHVSGWLPLMQTSGMLVKTRHRQPHIRWAAPLQRLARSSPPNGRLPRSRGGFTFDATDERYKVVRFKPSLHVPVFARASRFYIVLLGVSIPRTLDEWNDGLGSVARALSIQNNSSNYGFKWTYRAFMMTERAVRGLPSLSSTSKNICSDLSCA